MAMDDSNRIERVEYADHNPIVSMRNYKVVCVATLVYTASSGRQPLHVFILEDGTEHVIATTERDLYKIVNVVGSISIFDNKHFSKYTVAQLLQYIEDAVMFGKIEEFYDLLQKYRYSGYVGNYVVGHYQRTMLPGSVVNLSTQDIVNQSPKVWDIL